MIHLDTNHLIGLLVKGSVAALEVDGWLATGESLATSAIAWTEFLNGPVSPLEVSRTEAVLQSRITPFGQARVATINQADFKLFVPHGLTLAVSTPPPPAPAAGNTFEHIKRVTPAGSEFWSAREGSRV